MKRLQPLPSADEPVLIYLGVLKDGKTAVFLLDHDVEAIGDGVCKPTAEACETIRLRAGETEFFDVRDADGQVVAQYQLDLVKIHKSTTTSAAEAKASYAGSQGGPPHRPRAHPAPTARPRTAGLRRLRWTRLLDVLGLTPAPQPRPCSSPPRSRRTKGGWYYPSIVSQYGERGWRGGTVSGFTRCRLRFISPSRSVRLTSRISGAANGADVLCDTRFAASAAC